MKSIFEKLLPQNVPLKNDFESPFPMELLEYEIRRGGAMYYPSSGMDDIEHLFYINDKVIPEIDVPIPTVYIHSDAINNFDNYQYYNFKSKLSEPVHFRIINEAIYQNGKKTVIFFMLKCPNSNEYKWLICFSGFDNEIVLKQLIKKNIKTPIVYANCDGITSGMGGFGAASISTVLYPLLEKELGIHYIVTDQSWKKIFDRIEDFKDGLKHLLSISIEHQKTIKNLLKLTTEDIIIELGNILKRNIEQPLPQLDKMRFSHLILKRIEKQNTNSIIEYQNEQFTYDNWTKSTSPLKQETLCGSDYISNNEKYFIDKYAKNNCLDIGCGTGNRTFPEFERKGINYVGIEQFEHLKEFSKFSSKILLKDIASDSFQIDEVGNQKFDIAFYFGGVVNGFVSKNVRLTAWKNIEQVAQKQANYILFDTLSHFEWFHDESYEFGMVLQLHSMFPPQYFYSSKELKKLFAKHHLEIVEEKEEVLGGGSYKRTHYLLKHLGA